MASSEGDEVVVTVRFVGPSRPASLSLPPVMKVGDLQKRIASERNLPSDRLKLVLHGKTLHDKKNADSVEDATVKLAHGDCLMVAVMPTRPAKHLRGDDSDDDDEELKFEVPQTAGPWKRKVFTFLRHKLRIPDIMLMVIFSISLKAWVCIVLWFLLAPIAQKLDLGPIYIIGTGFLIILLNLGRRQHGELSAYSIFNEDFRELPGTLNAERFDRDIRAGRL
ncbi:Ubiquitin family protein [Rhynchospora pubera]|uniref:Ubiquitin family protein n=1 Tax=Rhynchospora pubera TaxID=906938 RepID=A0AAV8EIL1_9POAL|nr:Ubiquitin family protein [Rhynchospora pubera]